VEHDLHPGRELASPIGRRAAKTASVPCRSRPTHQRVSASARDAPRHTANAPNKRRTSNIATFVAGLAFASLEVCSQDHNHVTGHAGRYAPRVACRLAYEHGSTARSPSTPTRPRSLRRIGWTRDARGEAPDAGIVVGPSRPTIANEMWPGDALQIIQCVSWKMIITYSCPGPACEVQFHTFVYPGARVFHGQWCLVYTDSVAPIVRTSRLGAHCERVLNARERRFAVASPGEHR